MPSESNVALGSMGPFSAWNVYPPSDLPPPSTRKKTTLPETCPRWTNVVTTLPSFVCPAPAASTYELTVMTANTWSSEQP